MADTIKIENSVLECITSKNDIDELRRLFSEHDIKADIYDKDGMTPLQHACYKGNKEIAEFLLSKGADANYTKHTYGYTALHFAALSGNPDVCWLLMSAGAKSYATNSVNRTASQLAGFIGNHKCVAIINNFIPKSDVDYYTVKRGVETEPKLPPELSEPLYSYVMQITVHPIRLALNLPKILLEYIPQVSKVMELMSEREIKRGAEANEVLSFKLHYLRFVFCELSKCRSTEKQIDVVDIFSKKILRSPRGEEYLQQFVRDCIREFPFRDGVLFQQMVKSLVNKDEAPSALGVITCAINGQRGFSSDGPICVTCGEGKASKKCSKCRSVQYCDRECQRLHWFVHKKECARWQMKGPDEPGKKNNEPNGDADILNKLDELKVH